LEKIFSKIFFFEKNCLMVFVCPNILNSTINEKDPPPLHRRTRCAFKSKNGFSDRKGEGRIKNGQIYFGKQGAGAYFAEKIIEADEKSSKAAVTTTTTANHQRGTIAHGICSLPGGLVRCFPTDRDR